MFFLLRWILHGERIRCTYAYFKSGSCSSHLMASCFFTDEPTCPAMSYKRWEGSYVKKVKTPLDEH
jgi:predicted metal-binding protein